MSWVTKCKTLLWALNTESEYTFTSLTERDIVSQKRSKITGKSECNCVIMSVCIRLECISDTGTFRPGKSHWPSWHIRRCRSEAIVLSIFFTISFFILFHRLVDVVAWNRRKLRVFCNSYAHCKRHGIEFKSHFVSHVAYLHCRVPISHCNMLWRNSTRVIMKRACQRGVRLSILNIAAFVTIGVCPRSMLALPDWQSHASCDDWNECPASPDDRFQSLLQMLQDLTALDAHHISIVASGSRWYRLASRLLYDTHRPLTSQHVSSSDERMRFWVKALDAQMDDGVRGYVVPAFKGLVGQDWFQWDRTSSRVVRRSIICIITIVRDVKPSSFNDLSGFLVCDPGTIFA
jgi:hypothetical protein